MLVINKNLYNHINPLYSNRIIHFFLEAYVEIPYIIMIIEPFVVKKYKIKTYFGYCKENLFLYYDNETAMLDK